MSLYRTYRPQSLADVLGQDHIVTTLERAVAQDRLAQAYLFAGARGTGKTSVARILAKILLTKNINDEVLQRQIIKGVEDGSIVDLIEIDAASNTGVDHIRDLIEKIQFTPVVSNAKVYIIDEAHMLSKGASNALLKTLEEPPPYAFFILATTELQKIPLTIQSRCQRFLFRYIREEDIIRGLQAIADREHIVVDRAALRVIAHHAEGGMRDAISLLDQLRSLPKITTDEVKERIGEGGHEYVERIFTALDQRDPKELLGIIHKVEESGLPLDVLMRLLLTAVRTRLHEAIERNEPIDGLTRALGVLLEAIRDIRLAPVPGLVLEAALLDLCSEETGKKATTRSLFQNKSAPAETKKKGADAAGPPVTEERAEEKQESKADTTGPAPTVIEAPELTMEVLQGAWPEVLKAVATPSVRMSLKNGRIQEVKEQSVIVGFASAFHRDKVAGIEASRAVEHILERIFRRSLRLKCVVDQHDESVPPPDAASVDLAEAAAEVF